MKSLWTKVEIFFLQDGLIHRYANQPESFKQKQMPWEKLTST